MDAERWERVSDLVHEALKRPDPRERARFLRRACDGDRERRREVEELLAGEDEEGDGVDGVLAKRLRESPHPPSAPGRPSPPVHLLGEAKPAEVPSLAEVPVLSIAHVLGSA